MKLSRPIQIQICLFGGGLNTGLMVLACRMHRRRAQHRGNGGFPSSLHPEATELSLSLYVSGASQDSFPLPKAQVSACERVNLCAGPLKGHLRFQLPSVSYRRPESPLIFSQILWGLLFSAPKSWSGENGCSAGAPHSLGWGPQN